MARRDDSPDFIEAIARGLDVIRVFRPGQPVMSLASVAAASSLPRPTARRILLTLEQLGYVRQAGPQSAGQGHHRLTRPEGPDHVEAAGDRLDEVRAVIPTSHE